MNQPIKSDDPLLGLLKLRDLAAHLELMGWQKGKSPYAELAVYEGPKDIIGEPIKIILPSSDLTDDRLSMIARAVNTLSILEKISPEILIKQIAASDIDVLRIKVSHSLISFGSIALDHATQWLENLKNLVAYAAALEMNDTPTPFFRRLPQSGLAFTHKCRLAQSFAGSYGFTIECPIPEGQYSFIRPALERRTMERLMRGINLAAEAVSQHDGNILVERFDEGLNANMCEEVLKMFEPLRSPSFEYQVLWANEWGSPVESSLSKPIIIDARTCEYLEYAAFKLRRDDEIKQVTISGTISGWKRLTKSEAEDGREHIITVLWTDDQDRELKVRVALAPEQFPTIYEALNGRTVSVFGTLQRVGNNWHLNDAFNFKIVDE